jgi:hypothetical protein
MKNIGRNKFKSIQLAGIVLMTLVIHGCDNLEMDQATVTFAPITYMKILEPTAGQTTLPQVVKMRFSQPLVEDARIVFNVDPGNAKYGINYSSNPPEILHGEIAVNVFRGQTEAEFAVSIIGDGKFQDDYFIQYSVKSFSGGIRSKIQDTFIIKVEERDIPPTIYFNNFNDCTTDFATPAGFIEAFAEGAKVDRGWGCRGFGNGPSRGVQASGIGGDPGFEDAWLIIPEINADAYEFLVIRYWLESFYLGAGTMKVYWSNNYRREYSEEEITTNPKYYNDPLANGTWNEITSVNDKLPLAGSKDPKYIMGMISGVSGENVSIAFRYFGASNVNPSSWTIDDLGLYGTLKD